MLASEKSVENVENPSISEFWDKIVREAKESEVGFCLECWNVQKNVINGKCDECRE